MLVIKPPVITRLNGRFRIESAIGASSLWFALGDEYRDIVAADTMDAFVAGCLLPAMLSGQDMAVEGPMSGKLYYNLTHYLMPILKEYLPNLHIIAIRPAALQGLAAPRPGGVMTGFSGGIDSFCNYYDHSDGRAPAEYHITHFVYNNVGSHGQESPGQVKAVFAQRFGRLEEFVRRQNKPFIMVDSNLDEIIGMDFQLTHTIRNAAVALLMQKGIGKFLYASTYPFGKTRIAPSYDMAYLEPVILPLLGTERLDCIASGGQHSRVGKTACVSDMPASGEFLDVCVHPRDARDFINCSFCWKCLRTEATLSVLGKLDRYHKVFNVALYRRLEKLYLIEVLSSRDPLLREIAELIKARGFPIPGSIRFLAAFAPGFITRRMTRRVIPGLARRYDKRVSGGVTDSRR